MMKNTQPIVEQILSAAEHLQWEDPAECKRLLLEIKWLAHAIERRSNAAFDKVMSLVAELVATTAKLVAAAGRAAEAAGSAEARQRGESTHAV